ncbi:MAG: 16S rRNA (cytosine(967)-C(5))-methyltransferase RsmB [Gammaproteobacteria bacterium]|nr:16S rRNA (cytosine(967)-C(5))-methyltransferase RsmB [Gammaproteobacteria bacterium]
MSRSTAIRVTVARLVSAVIHDNESLDTALRQALLSQQKGSARDDAALIQEMAYGTLRWSPQLEAVAGELLERPLKPKDHDVHVLLLVGLYQLMHMRLKPYAAVTETVAAAEGLGKPWCKGLINACLRAFLRDRESLLNKLEHHPASATNHPLWLLTQIQQAWPEHWQAIVNANNERPPMTLRVNLLRNSREAYLRTLHDASLSATVVEQTDCGLTLDQPVPVTVLPQFAQGSVSVQDAGAQLAAPLLQLKPSQRALDACAAPGGKLCHMLERCPRTDIVALEKDPARIALIEENLARLQLHATVVVGDAANPNSWWDDQQFDCILADVPCSTTGVVRRHPDIKVRRNTDDLRRLTAIQSNIIEGLWPLVRSGGKLLYVTCSILAAENEGQMSTFLARHADAATVALSLPVGIPRKLGIQLLPGQQGMDGFYYACLQKK